MNSPTLLQSKQPSSFPGPPWFPGSLLFKGKRHQEGSSKGEEKGLKRVSRAYILGIFPMSWMRQSLILFILSGGINKVGLEKRTFLSHWMEWKLFSFTRNRRNIIIFIYNMSKENKNENFSQWYWFYAYRKSWNICRWRKTTLELSGWVWLWTMRAISLVASQRNRDINMLKSCRLGIDAEFKKTRKIANVRPSLPMMQSHLSCVYIFTKYYTLKKSQNHFLAIFYFPFSVFSFPLPPLLLLFIALVADWKEQIQQSHCI